MSASLLSEIILNHAQPIDPIPTGEQSVLRELFGIRAVMFDVYGTLLISASGDIDASDSASKGQAFVEALSAIGIHYQGDGDSGAQLLVDQIQSANAQAQQNGIEFPEVDIVAIWRQVMSKINRDCLDNPITPTQPVLTASLDQPNLMRLALEYEMRVNPVWPMPHARECLENLFKAGLCLGIISNAQCFTIDILQTLLHADSEGFAFEDDLQYYSYQHGQAKPGIALYKLASERLAQRGIRASEVLYIGNDMLKDVMPAASVGFRTALFAGDARSLRRRKEDARVVGVTPDLVITDLSDVPKYIS